MPPSHLRASAGIFRILADTDSATLNCYAELPDRRHLFHRAGASAVRVQNLDLLFP